jgi:curved DNA-binding protein CbpA
MADESYYELLQVTPTADLEIITGAYRALIRRHHPDRNPSPIAEATTKRLNEAWEVLSDPAKRAEYDRERKGRTSRPSSETRQTNDRPYQNRPSPPPRPKTPQAGRMWPTLSTVRLLLAYKAIVSQVENMFRILRAVPLRRAKRLSETKPRGVHVGCPHCNGYSG